MPTSLDRSRWLAGIAFVGVGAIMTLGFITAAALYPGYSIARQTISALGAADAPLPSRAVFNGTMVGAGAVTLAATYGVHRSYGRPSLTGILAVTATVGLMGVGLFPADTGLPHVVAALVAFGGVGVAAVVVATIVPGPFRYLSLVLGMLELSVLGAFVALGEATPLGVGGLERWVAHLGLIWTTAFGGVLLGSPQGE